jgi:stearoyl-CoA desaturase (delta-9 desaturase)
MPEAVDLVEKLEVLAGAQEFEGGEEPPRPPGGALPPWRKAVLTARFLAVHAVCGLVYWAGVSWWAVALCVGMYYLRMFAVTAVYHRYFSHRTFKMGRPLQLVLATLGTTALQKGPLWWAAHHRHHHRFSDTERDIHSPTRRGFFWAHVGWILSDDYDETDWARIRDFARFPELRWLNRWHAVPFTVLCVVFQLTMGFQALVWGCFVSTVLLWHGTFTINSLAHVFGKRVYETADTSRNSFLLALITMGEGWHNNHHYYQASANQGFHWWQVDVTFWILVGMEKLGLVRDLKRAPAEVVAGRRAERPLARAAAA